MYDVLILGGGPAGCTAALYCARSALRCVVLTETVGGQMALTPHIDNYPGAAAADGFALAEKMREQARSAGAEFVSRTVQTVSLAGNVKSADGFHGKTAILATGASAKRLGLANEAALLGRGVSYCAACDGAFFRGKRVGVVGGGNTAAGDALLLSRICSEVHLIHRRDALRAGAAERQALCGLKNLHIHWNSEVTALLADEFLRGVELHSLSDNTRRELALDGLFVAIGRTPQSALFAEVDRDEAGYLKADESTLTNLPGVFAAGDVRTKSLRQIVTATADGAVSAFAAENYLRGRP